TLTPGEIAACGVEPRRERRSPGAVFFLLHFPCPSGPPLRSGRRTVGVTHHRVLWSPDFPLPGPPTAMCRRGSPGSDRPAGLRFLFHYTRNAPGPFSLRGQEFVQSQG